MFLKSNTKKQGDIGLGAAVAWFTSKLWTVAIPLTDSQDYDLIVDDGSKPLRCQVKTSSHKSEYGIYEVSLTVKGGNRSASGKIKKFDKSKVDLLFILTDDGNKYLIPSSEVGTSGLNLGEKYEKFKL